MLTNTRSVELADDQFRLDIRTLSSPVEKYGRLIEIGETLVKVSMPWVSLGEICYIHPQMTPAEVVFVHREYALVSPFSSTHGFHCGQWVESSGSEYKIPVGRGLLGMMVDGLGRPLGGSLTSVEEYRSLYAPAPDPMDRQLISQPLPLGIKAIDGIMTCGIGQRVGIFAPAGGGKSTLLSMICDGTEADVIVLALVGERGREVREFLELTLSEESRKKCVLVVATSERPALERLKASFTATTIAEFFRDKGLNVVLMIDSLTRYARAVREVGLAAGEPPVAGGFPPSLYAHLPRLLERSGPSDKGNITGIFTVLVEGDANSDLLADEIRSLLDGHIILSRKLASSNHYPAIDINASVSRVMHMIADPMHIKLAAKLRRMMALYNDNELLIRVGEYQFGQDPEADHAIKGWPCIRDFLCQSTGDKIEYNEILNLLKETVS